MIQATRHIQDYFLIHTNPYESSAWSCILYVHIHTSLHTKARSFKMNGRHKDTPNQTANNNDNDTAGNMETIMAYCFLRRLITIEINKFLVFAHRRRERVRETRKEGRTKTHPLWPQINDFIYDVTELSKCELISRNWCVWTKSTRRIIIRYENRSREMRPHYW